MKKLILSASILLFSGIIAIGQTTASDFTASDCSSGNHTLFTELNAGNVVVLVWVMPCSMCISDAKAAYDAVQGFSTSNPGKVIYWLSDDAGNTSCSALSSWASTNSIGTTGSAYFGNTGNAIDEANYGGSGMPHVVVMGGSSHTIYYNQKNGSSDGAAITSAINTAIAATTGVGNVSNSVSILTLFPNPAKNNISLKYGLDNAAPVNIEVYDIVGKNVKTVALGEQSSGEHSLDLNFENKLANGVFFLKMNVGNASQIVKFAIAD
jgi:type IX secretion system substrate protein